jgi:phage gpG-like protein
MPAGNFKVKVDDRAVMRALQRLRSSLGDLRPALGNAAKELTRRIQYRFAFKRDPDGKRWAPWAKSTAAKYAGQPRHKLMLFSRQLRANSKFVAGTKDLRAVVGMPYGAFHEQAGGGGTGRIPRRAFLFSLRNGGRALALSDETYLLNALRYQIRKASQN